MPALSNKNGTFARPALEASHEACLLAGFENQCRGNNAVVFLTKLDGGVYGNDVAWIRNAAGRALELAGDWSLDVPMMHFGEVEGGLGA